MGFVPDVADRVGIIGRSTQTALHMDSITKMEDDLQAVRSQLYKASPAASCFSETELEKDDKRFFILDYQTFRFSS